MGEVSIRVQTLELRHSTFEMTVRDSRRDVKREAVETSLEFRRTFQGGDGDDRMALLKPQEHVRLLKWRVYTRQEKQQQKYSPRNKTSPHQIWQVSLQFQQISLFFLLNQSCGHFE